MCKFSVIAFIAHLQKPTLYTPHRGICMCIYKCAYARDNICVHTWMSASSFVLFSLVLSRHHRVHKLFISDLSSQEKEEQRGSEICDLRHFYDLPGQCTNQGRSGTQHSAPGYARTNKERHATRQGQGTVHQAPWEPNAIEQSRMAAMNKADRHALKLTEMK